MGDHRRHLPGQDVGRRSMSGASTTRDGGAPSARWSTLRNAFLSAVAASKTTAGEGGRGGGDTAIYAPAAPINSSSSKYTNSSSGGGASIVDEEKRFEGFQLFPRCLNQRYCSVVSRRYFLLYYTPINLRTSSTSSMLDAGCSSR